MRGLWGRNGLYYTQIRVNSRKGRLRLEHAETLPQAIEAMQALKKQRRVGTLQAPRRKASPAQSEAQGGGSGAPAIGGAQGAPWLVPVPETFAHAGKNRAHARATCKLTRPLSRGRAIWSVPEGAGRVETRVPFHCAR